MELVDTVTSVLKACLIYGLPPDASKEHKILYT
jgi:hypothetical protein